MQRNQPRRNAERNATQPIAGQPRDDDDDGLQQPDDVPSFLTAQELQAHDPAKDDDEDDDTVGERHASASFTGAKGEPPITDEEPPRGKRGLPEKQTDEMLKAGKAKRGKSAR